MYILSSVFVILVSSLHPGLTIERLHCSVCTVQTLVGLIQHLLYAGVQRSHAWLYMYTQYFEE